MLLSKKKGWYILMSKIEKKSILDKIEKLEKILDSWGFYKEPNNYKELRRELDSLYNKLGKE